MENDVDSFQEEEVLDEEARKLLEARCNEVIGNEDGANRSYSILAECLSYFPETAELFIETQKHGTSVIGEKKFHLIVRHKEDKSPGFRSIEFFKQNQDEALSIHGFTGKKSIDVINALANFKGHGDRELFEGRNEWETEQIARVFAEDAGRNSKSVLMGKKVFELMGMTNEDIAFIVSYREHKRMYKILREKISEYATSMLHLVVIGDIISQMATNISTVRELNERLKRPVVNLFSDKQQSSPSDEAIQRKRDALFAQINTLEETMKARYLELYPPQE